MSKIITETRKVKIYVPFLCNNCKESYEVELKHLIQNSEVDEEEGLLTAKIECPYCHEVSTQIESLSPTNVHIEEVK